MTDQDLQDTRPSPFGMADAVNRASTSYIREGFDRPSVLDIAKETLPGALVMRGDAIEFIDSFPEQEGFDWRQDPRVAGNYDLTSQISWSGLNPRSEAALDMVIGRIQERSNRQQRIYGTFGSTSLMMAADILTSPSSFMPLSRSAVIVAGAEGLAIEGLQVGSSRGSAVAAAGASIGIGAIPWTLRGVSNLARGAPFSEGGLSRVFANTSVGRRVSGAMGDRLARSMPDLPRRTPDEINRSWESVDPRSRWAEIDAKYRALHETAENGNVKFEEASAAYDRSSDPRPGARRASPQEPSRADRAINRLEELGLTSDRPTRTVAEMEADVEAEISRRQRESRVSAESNTGEAAPAATPPRQSPLSDDAPEPSTRVGQSLDGAEDPFAEFADLEAAFDDLVNSTSESTQRALGRGSTAGSMEVDAAVTARDNELAGLSFVEERIGGTSGVRVKGRAVHGGSDGIRSPLQITDLPLTPRQRLMGAMSSQARELATRLFDMGGLMLQRNLDGVPTSMSVDTKFRSNWQPKMFKVVQTLDGEYLRMHGIDPDRPQSSGFSFRNNRATRAAGVADVRSGRRSPGVRNAMSVQSMQVRRTLQKRGINVGDEVIMSRAEFSNAVGRAMENGDVDANNPFVTNAARELRKIVDDIHNQAMDVNLYGEGYRQRARLIDESLDRGWVTKDGERHYLLQSEREALAKRRQSLLDQADTIDAEGPVVAGNNKSYFAHIWNHQGIIENYDEFLSNLTDDLVAWGAPSREIASNDAVGIAQAIVGGKISPDDFLDRVTRKQFERYSDDLVGTAGSSKARTLPVDGNKYDKFLVRDAEQVLTYQLRTMGMDIEFMREFGSLDLVDYTKAIREEYEDMLKTVSGTQQEGRVRSQMQQVLTDIRDGRDILRGIYGLPHDPFSLKSRVIRSAKAISYLTWMGGAVASQVVDIARPTMAYGFQRAFGSEFKALIKNTRGIQLMKEEMNQAGVALDLVMGMRATMFADPSDLFANKSPFERGLYGATQIMSTYLNGLNAWNSVAKTWAGAVASTNLLAMAQRVAGGVGSQSDIAGLARLNIDEAMAGSIDTQARRFAEDVDGVMIPNTDQWLNPKAQEAFRQAINADVDRVIVTPRPGDSPTLFSSELGSAIFQFKQFGMGSLYRVLASGLQERSANFVIGGSMMIGLGWMVNELQGRNQGMEVWQQTLGAVNRSGIDGILADVRNAGFKLATLASGNGDLSTAGWYAGPSAQIAAVWMMAAGDLANGEGADRILQAVPGTTMFMVGDAMDRVARTR